MVAASWGLGKDNKYNFTPTAGSYKCDEKLVEGLK
jgi:hypothetical protein